ncbi:MAG: hypothetical protein JNM39_09125 [Bdellovibrionaceae bacterium]|nr:hypothetical protein [Pseudobdellovibrionaceae bacterium]
MMGSASWLCLFGLMASISGFAWVVGARASNTASRTYVLDSQKVPLEPGQTFSNLLVLPNLHPTYQFEIQLQFKVIRQYRGVGANPWESFWLFWGYNLDGAERKKTNYILFKTNGLEIGKASELTTQEFLWTGPEPKIIVGVWNDLVVAHRESQLFLRLNGQIVKLDGLELSKLYRYPGRIAFYAEDAKVLVRKFEIKF